MLKVRPAVRLGAGIGFWAAIVGALVANGALWPIKGFWPLFLVALALAIPSLLGAAVLYLPHLRARLVIQGAESAEAVAPFEVPVIISMALLAVFLFRAFNEL